MITNITPEYLAAGLPEGCVLFTVYPNDLEGPGEYGHRKHPGGKPIWVEAIGIYTRGNSSLRLQVGVRDLSGLADKRLTNAPSKWEVLLIKSEEELEMLKMLYPGADYRSWEEYQSRTLFSLEEWENLAQEETEKQKKRAGKNGKC